MEQTQGPHNQRTLTTLAVPRQDHPAHMDRGRRKSGNLERKPVTHWTQPLGQARTRQDAKHHLEQQQAQLLVRIAREVDGRLPERQAQAALPGDPWQLRGVPVVGVYGGVGGAINGTRPDAIR